MADLLRERLMEVLAHTLSAENEDAGESDGPEAPTLPDVEPVVTSDDLAVQPRDERARVAASVIGALWAAASSMEADLLKGREA